MPRLVDFSAHTAAPAPEGWTGRHLTHTGIDVHQDSKGWNLMMDHSLHSVLPSQPIPFGHSNSDWTTSEHRPALLDTSPFSRKELLLDLARQLSATTLLAKPASLRQDTGVEVLEYRVGDAPPFTEISQLMAACTSSGLNSRGFVRARSVEELQSEWESPGARILAFNVNGALQGFYQFFDYAQGGSSMSQSADRLFRERMHTENPNLDVSAAYVARIAVSRAFRSFESSAGASSAPEGEASMSGQGVQPRSQTSSREQRSSGHHTALSTYAVLHANALLSVLSRTTVNCMLGWVRSGEHTNPAVSSHLRVGWQTTSITHVFPELNNSPELLIFQDASNQDRIRRFLASNGILSPNKS